MHNLLIAKLHAFGFDLKSFRVIPAYLKDRIQVTKAASLYSEIIQIIYGFPKGSILGPLLFNVNLIGEEYKSDFSITHMTPLPITVGAHFWELYQTWR